MVVGFKWLIFPMKIYGHLQGQTSTVRLIQTSIKGHCTGLVCEVLFNQSNIVKTTALLNPKY